MMFAPKPRDTTKIAELLSIRSGKRVSLINVPFVDRDINGTVAFVTIVPTVPMKTYLADGFVPSLERRADLTICFMATQGWELDRLWENYFAWHRSLSQ